MKKPVGPYDSYYRYKCIDNRNAESGKIDQICFSRRYTNYMNMSSHNIVMFHSVRDYSYLGWISTAVVVE